MTFKVTFKPPQPENSHPESSASSVSGSTRPSRAKAINSVKELVQKLQESTRGKRKQAVVDTKSERSPKRHKSAGEVESTAVIPVDKAPADEAAKVQNATTPVHDDQSNSVSEAPEQPSQPTTPTTPIRTRKSLPVTLKYRKNPIDKSTKPTTSSPRTNGASGVGADRATRRQRLRLKPPSRPESSAKLATATRSKRHRPARNNNNRTTTTTSPKSKPTTTKNNTKVAAAAAADTELCVVCKGAKWYDGNNIVFCDGCNDAYHRFCHNPAISSDVIDVLEANWFCKSCEDKKQRSEDVVTSNVPAWSGMTGENISLEDKRFYLQLLPSKKLVELLLYSESLHPDLPIYHSKAERIINSFRTTAVLHDEETTTTNNNASHNNNNNNATMTAEGRENEMEDDENVIPANFRADGGSGSNGDGGNNNTTTTMTTMAMTRSSSNKSNGVANGGGGNGEVPAVNSVSHWWHPKYGKIDTNQPDVKMGRVPGVKYTL